MIKSSLVLLLPIIACPALIHLQELSLSRNQLGSVPGELGHCTGLTSLDLSHNQLDAVPGQMCEGLTNLTGLNLMCNKLTQLPEQFGKMDKLR